MAYSALLVGIANGVATITLNRPEKLNAYNAAMGAELSQAFAALDGDDQVRVVVVTGAGRAFCAGADLSTAGGDTFNYDKRRERGELREAPAIRPWNMKKRSSRRSMAPRWESALPCRCSGTSGWLRRVHESASCSCDAE